MNLVWRNGEKDVLLFVLFKPKLNKKNINFLKTDEMTRVMLHGRGNNMYIRYIIEIIAKYDAVKWVLG